MILAGDIGGTKTNLALFDRKGERLVPTHERSFPSRQYEDFLHVIEQFLQSRKVSLTGACFGVAGPVFQGRSQTTNLPWMLDANQIGSRFGIPSVTLLNDLEATAFGSLFLTKNEYCPLNPGQPHAQGNRAIVAAGTGLGEGVLFWDGSHYQPLASEGGHCDFAPRNPMEMRLLEYLLRKYSRVSYERILSGPGLFNIYRFLKETGHGKEPPWLSDRLEKEDPGVVITQVGLLGRSDLCSKTLGMFVSIYGAEAGNIALKVMATGGVYIGGGIGPKILDKLSDGTFMKAFLDKGRFAVLMGNIPVRLILNEKTALIGAAQYALHHGTDGK